MEFHFSKIEFLCIVLEMFYIRLFQVAFTKYTIV